MLKKINGGEVPPLRQHGGDLQHGPTALPHVKSLIKMRVVVGETSFLLSIKCKKMNVEMKRSLVTFVIVGEKEMSPSLTIEYRHSFLSLFFLAATNVAKYFNVFTVF